MWPWTRRASSPASTASSTSPRSCPGVASASAGSCRQQVGALQEQALAVDRTRPVVPGDHTQAGAPSAPVAELAVDDDLDLDVGQRLIAERAWPPQRRVGDVEVPVHLVETARHVSLILEHEGAVDERADRYRGGPGRCRAGRSAAGVPEPRRRRGTAPGSDRSEPVRCRRRARGARGPRDSSRGRCRPNAGRCR